MLSVNRTRKAMVGLIGAFFIQGFMAVSWLPRIPEVIDNLQVPFSTWGLIIGIGGIGGMLPLLFANKLINRFGTRPLLQLSLVVVAITLSSFGFIHDPWVFFLAVLMQNFSYGLYNIAVNAHSVVFQNRIGKIILGRFHAAWSIGAASSSLITGLLAPIVPLHTYLAGIGIFGLVIFFIAATQMLGPSEDGHEQERKRAASVPLFKTPGYVLMLAVGLFAGVLPELTMMDWGAIFAKSTLHLSQAQQGMPYTIFVTAMILSRLSIGRLTKRRHISRVGQLGALLGSISLALAIILGTALAGVSPMLAFGVTAIFWVTAGLGTGPQVPSFFSNAGNVDGITTAQAMSRMSLINSTIILGIKVLMGAIAQGFGVPMVFALPVVSFIGAAFISGYVVRRAKRVASPASEAAAELPVEAFPVTAPNSVITEEEAEGL
jgi:MFS family permease